MSTDNPACVTAFLCVEELVSRLGALFSESETPKRLCLFFTVLKNILNIYNGRSTSTHGELVNQLFELFKNVFQNGKKRQRRLGWQTI